MTGTDSPLPPPARGAGAPDGPPTWDVPTAPATFDSPSSPPNIAPSNPPLAPPTSGAQQATPEPAASDTTTGESTTGESTTAESRSAAQAIPRRKWVPLIAVAAVLMLIGGYLVLHSVAATRDNADGESDSSALPALPTDEHTGWIASGTYHLPGEIAPGLYRVGRGFSFRNDGEDVDRDSSVTAEGTTLVVIPEQVAPCTITIEGGAWPLKENGPVDPMKFQDGTYLVGFDIDPGTYRVSRVPRRVDMAAAGRLDSLNSPIQAEFIGTADAADDITITIEESDFAFYFTGHLEPVD